MNQNEEPSRLLLVAVLVAVLLANSVAAFVVISKRNGLNGRKNQPQPATMILSAHHDESSQSALIDRRSLLSIQLSTLAVAGYPSCAIAAKGAAEYDLEYYMRDLVMGNKKEGNLPQSNAPPAAPSRTLRDPMLSLLLDDDLKSSVPIQELSRITTIPIDTLAEQINSYKLKVAPAFKTNHPWKNESVSDQYYFDLTCYALWKVASVVIQDYSVRDKYVRSIGSRLLKEMMQQDLLSKNSIQILNKSDNKLTDLIPCIVEVLDLFQSSSYCTSYRLGDKNDEERSGVKVFDELDDEEITSPNGGGSVDCLVSIFDPATLGGSLQITGEGSRFSPDFVGPTLAALFERVEKCTVNFDSFFVDPVYRPNPKDFFPNERFYQFTITRKS